MSAQPRWEDSGQSDLLELVAQGSPSTGSADEEWAFFCSVLRRVECDGIVNPNDAREHLRDEIAHKRIGAFYSRALRSGLLRPTGSWVVSSDTTGGNAGRPVRTYWLGAS